MPYKNKADRKYANATKYESSPTQLKNREARNSARASFMKKGLVHKGDGLDVDHRVPISEGGKPGKGNLRTESAHDNRSYARNADRTPKIRKSKKK